MKYFTGRDKGLQDVSVLSKGNLLSIGTFRDEGFVSLQRILKIIFKMVRRTLIGMMLKIKVSEVNLGVSDASKIQSISIEC
jgi:hypothetical protein